MLIFLVFCVVVFGGGSVVLIFLVSVFWYLMGSVVLIFLVFCVVVFGGVFSSHLVSFLCCGIWWGGPWCSSF